MIFLLSSFSSLNILYFLFLPSEINIEYMYAFAGKKDAYMIFRVSDTKKSESILNGRGLKSLSQEEISAV